MSGMYGWLNEHIHVKAFCLECKSSRLSDWTTGNKSLDSLIMKSWSIIARDIETCYIQWIEYSRLTNIRETSLLDHECTHSADWLESTGTHPSKMG